MAGVDLDHISKRYQQDGDPVIDNLTLSIADGSFTALLGPSGCGKTTLLRMIAGLTDPDAGDIRIGDRSVIGLEPKDRDIALVFQQYALYPHMTVFENIEYPLKVQKMGKEERNEKVAFTAERLGLASLLDRKPAELSGGEQQRVALARAIVREPIVFLMDEPLSNLDAQLRLQMRSELRAMQQNIGITTIFVTHDQTEAMTMADRIVLLNGGVIQQSGNADDLYDHPANIFVAGFIGHPPMNLLPARRAGKRLVAAGVWLLPAPAGDYPGEVTVGLRPEDIDLRLSPQEGFQPFPVYLSEAHGSEAIVNVWVGDQVVRVRTKPHTRPAAGETVYLAAEPDKLHLFDAESGVATW